ncbi:uncharacterized protein LOC134217032 [Armigeres subalbatus]|uniref:uncharacterized protein LOC134217032 n=1 Tax=Armigeres subalbatus TaxID=124917 RepID=UPI002ED123CC
MAVHAVICAILLAAVYSTVQGKITFVFEDDIHECDNGLPLPHVDISQVQIYTEDDGTITINGTTRFTNDYGGPVRWKMYTKRLERGQWVAGIIQRDVFDMCAILTVPNELWYPLVKKLNKQKCPFQKGYEEHMNMINLGNPAEMLNFPPEFVGEWQSFHEITTNRRGFPAKECFKASMSITEV